MTGEKKKQVAVAPASHPVTVRGIEFTVDSDFVNSWAAFELIRDFNNDELDTFQKLDLSMRLIEKATGVTQTEIVEASGGDMAPAIEVVNTAVEIVQAILPKN